MSSERASDSTPLDWEGNRGARIEDIVGGYIERLNLGEEIEPEDVLAEYPDLAREILDHLHCFLDFAPGSDTNNAPLGTLGDYTLRRQIGRGGMGVVYDAWQNSVDRQVALKVLPGGTAVDNKAFIRFIREARTAAQLSHPNIVRVHGMGQEESTPYYSMEFVDGQTLAQILARIKEADRDTDTPFGPKDEVEYFAKLARVFADVADGLQHAHSKGVVHRDIKPSNLILDGEDRLRILDFGLARLEGQESLTLSGDFVGTPYYMSPEQARRRKVPIDHRTDVYSLGATLYEAICGRPPFRGKDHHDTLSQIIERDPGEPRKINPRIPKGLETIVLKCLRKDSGDRYGTAEALGQDLRRFVRGDPIEAVPQSAWEKLGRRLSRYKTIMVAAAIVLMLAFAGLAVGIVLINQAWSVANEERQDAINQRNARTRELYVANISRATEDWKAGNVSRFEKLLERHVPEPGEKDLRGWEWYYLNGLRGQELFKVQAHSERVESVAWSPDGRFVASGQNDGKVALWDAKTVWDAKPRRLFDLPGEIGPNGPARRGHRAVRELSWRHDSRLLAAGTDSGVVKVWDIESCREVESYLAHGRRGPGVHTVSWSPDGRLLASGGRGGKVRIREFLGNEEGFGKEDRVLHPPRPWILVRSVSWSPDSRRLAVAGEAGLALWDHAAPEKLRELKKHTGTFLCVAWSPDGRCLAWGKDDGEIGFTDTGTWEPLRSLVAHAGAVVELGWGPGGDLLASGGRDGLVKVWDVEGGKEPLTIPGHTSTVWSVDWSPCGRYIVSGSQDGTVRFWDAAGKPESRTLPGRSPVDWSPDGRWLAARGGEEDGVVLFDASSEEPLREFQQPPGCFAFSPDGTRIAIAGGSRLKLWDCESGRELGELQSKSSDGLPAMEFRHFAWSPNGRFLLTAEQESCGRVHLRIWDLETQAANYLMVLRWGYESLVWNPRGHLLAVAGYFANVVVYDVHDVRALKEVHRFQRHVDRSRWAPAGGRMIVWDPTGKRLAAGGAEGTLVVWDLLGGKELRTRGHLSNVRCVDWSPDGDRIATGSEDRTVKIWDAETLDELLVLRGHEKPVYSVAWSPDGNRLLTASLDTARIWDAPGYGNGSVQPDDHLPQRSLEERENDG